tara:strand:+ start:1144 stop:1722 length:579 start_codon:yes stop_codon:yes gene_type:complete
MNNDYNIFWGIIFIYFLGLFLCVMIPSEAYAVTEVSTTTNSESDVKSKGRTVVISPPPSAISPSIGSSSSDICTSGVSGAIQTQILGVSTGETVRDENCERLKISKTLYDMGMKVAAVSVLCQDRRVYDAMGMAGTPCPFLGEIGTAAAKKWVLNPELIPEPIILETKQDVRERQGWIASGIVTLAMLLFLL